MKTAGILPGDYQPAFDNLNSFIVHSSFLKNDLLYQVALTRIPQIGSVQARLLVEQFGSAEAIFRAKIHQLEKTEGIGSVRAKSIKEFNSFKEAEKEISFINKYKINPLFISETSYPTRLRNCYDPPTLLYYKGETSLNTSKIVAIVGTRVNSDYGKHLTENLISVLSNQQVLIVSGMAFGIDALAHKAALKNNLPTVGVLAHGLDTIYPIQHSSLAKEIIKQGGGMLTEFCSTIKPDKHNFPTRNRIVAGMSDAIVVIESGIKGGSMVTAELGNGYNKDIFAFPGKTTDSKSAGCNYLIKNNKATLLTNAFDLIQLMGWEEKKKAVSTQQKELFIQLTTEEKIITDLLREKDKTHIDELNLRSGLSSSSVASAILTLELQLIIQSLPGKIYRLI
ncbi:MAG: DNA-processing protein DprA [Chitinophagaceae bacterium]